MNSTKYLVVTMISMALLLTGSFVSAQETLLQDKEISVSSDMAFLSKYIWRGMKLDDDAVLQPGLYVSGYGFDLSVWGSTDIDSDDALSSEEVDYSISYSYSIPDTIISLSGGATYYDFTAADSASKEWFVGMGLDMMLSPSLTYYHDFGEEDSGGGDGDYVSLGLSHQEPIGDLPMTLDLGTSIGYNDKLFINGEGVDVALSVGITIKVTEICTVQPIVHYSMPFGDLEDADDGNYDDEFYGGAVIAFSL